MKPLKIKGAMSDLKGSLQSLKCLFEEVENNPPKGKEDQYIMQEKDLSDIRRHGQSQNDKA